MARGWESKAVEEQIGLAEDSKSATSRQHLTASQLERRKRKESLLMEKRRLRREMEQGHKKRYLALLERAMTHIDAELAKLDGEPD